MKTLITTISASLFAATLIASAHAALTNNTAGLTGGTAAGSVVVLGATLPSR
jgi:hypothetical protein